MRKYEQLGLIDIWTILVTWNTLDELIKCSCSILGPEALQLIKNDHIGFISIMNVLFSSLVHLQQSN